MERDNQRVVIVHDYATQRGGAERVTIGLLRAFPGARLVTSCWDPSGTFPEFTEFDIETLWTDRVRAFRQDPRLAFPFLASAFRKHTITDADVIICSSSGWAHRIDSPAPKIVYCHNPARWLYQPRDYFAGLPQVVTDRIVGSSKSLRQSDFRAAHSADRYVVNSTTVAARVHAAYGLDSTVIAPPRGVGPEGPQRPVAGLEPGFLLTISRPRGYKHLEAVCDAVATMPGRRLVVVGDDAESWPLSVTALNNVDDEEMRWLYANAAGLVAVAYEDFGLTPVEAQAFGLPAVVLRSGGYLDSAIEGTTAVFVDEPTPAAVAAGIREMEARSWSAAAIRHAGERYSAASFAAQMHDVVDEVLTGVQPATVRPYRVAARRLQLVAPARLPEALPA